MEGMTDESMFEMTLNFSDEDNNNNTSSTREANTPTNFQNEEDLCVVIESNRTLINALRRELEQKTILC